MSNGVAVADTNGSKLDPNSTEPVKVETPESEKVESLGCAIEEAVEKIKLLGTTETCVGKIAENGLDREVEGKGKSESESEVESSEAESESSSSSSGESSSSSDGSDSDEEEDDGDGEEDEEKGEEGQEQGDADVEVEERGIKSSDDDDDDDKMASWRMADDDDADVVGDEDDGDAAGGGPIRSKNELEDLPPVPPVDVTLEPHHQMLPVGAVMSTLDTKVIVEGAEKHNPLSEGSILWITESRKPLGFIDEIFGPVKNPFYVVRYNSEDEVPTEIHGGTLVSFVPEFANHVLNNNKDLYKKGYDASGANDEELSDEYEFSDDEKEAEHRRMQKMSKRGANDQNPGQRKNNRKKASPKEHAVPRNPNKPATSPIPNRPATSPIPNSPAAPMLGHGNRLPFTGNGQGPFMGTTAFPPFQIPPNNAGPNFAANGVWPNGATLPQQQPQPGMFPNAFPANGIPWFPQNTQFPNQSPMQGVPFQQQLHLNQGAMLHGMQPNMFAQPMFAQGPFGQNQMAFGLNPQFQQMQPPMVAAPQQGFPSGELQPERNPNFHPNANPGARPQFRPGASAASNGRRKFHGGGRKGWRPAK